MQLSRPRREALEVLRDNRELLQKGNWWGTQSKEWLVPDWTMHALKRLKLARVDTVGESSFAVITPKGERALIGSQE